MSSPTEGGHDLIGNCWCGGIVHQTGASIVTSTVCEVCGEPNASGYNRCPECPRRGKQATCTCGRAWAGHPEPHAATCPLFGSRSRDERIAQEIEAQCPRCDEHWPMPRGDCWICQRHGAFTRAAQIVRGEHGSR